MRPPTKVKKHSGARKQCARFSFTGLCRFGEGCKFPHVVESGKTSLRGVQQSTQENTAVRNGTATHLDNFFAKYPQFPYNPSTPVMTEFSRMCAVFHWDMHDRQKPRQLFNDAITQQFNTMYRTNVDDVITWRNLCQILGIHPIPDDLEECRRKVANTHANLVDLVDMAKTGETIVVFGSAQELSLYLGKAQAFSEGECSREGSP